MGVHEHEQLADERALVVGASRGMGRAIATRFADEGARVAVAARTVADLETVAEGLSSESLAVACDLRETDSVDRAVDRAVDAFGGLDIVVNSAGVLVRGSLTETGMADHERVVDVNLTGAIRLSRAVLPALAESEGTLLHVSSEAGQFGVPELPSYCASKGGLDALVRQLAVEYGPEGVRVNAIAPGTTKTSMNERVRREDPSWEEERREGIPLGRLGTTDDVANLATFLASDEADYISGEIVSVDGGSSA